MAHCPAPSLADPAQDHQTWSVLMHGYRQRLPRLACREFIADVAPLGFHATQVVALDDLDTRLDQACGWHLQPVDGLLDDRSFFTALSERRFPVASRLRRPDEIDFSAQPDLFHDALGHLPLLLDPRYSDFLLRYAAIAVRHLDDAIALQGLQRFYWHTIETGLLREAGQLKVLGAAILTSESECRRAMAASTCRAAFDFETVLQACYEPTRLQPRYFVIDSFDAITDLVDRLEPALRMSKAARTSTRTDFSAS